MALETFRRLASMEISVLHFRNRRMDIIVISIEQNSCISVSNVYKDLSVRTYLMTVAKMYP